MKKLKKVKYDFSNFENKKLLNLKTVCGGATDPTSKCKEPTNGGNDYEYYQDGVHVATITFGDLEC